MAKPIPPGDLDLIHLSTDQLKGEVAAMTVYLSKVDGWRLRRARAMRRLRDEKVPRNEVAELAQMTSGAVLNVINDLIRGEEAWLAEADEIPAVVATDDDPPCDRCDDPFSWHKGRREHPRDLGQGCVPPADEGRTCFCAQYEAPQPKENPDADRAAPA
jgi:hypothetical protein